MKDPTERRLESLLRDAAQVVPDRIAVVDPQTKLTYGELDAMSDALAARLLELGVERGDRVALWAPKSCRSVALMQAALRIGAAYVPIDAGTPASRALSIMNDCAVKLLATTGGLSTSGFEGPKLLLELETYAPREPLPPLAPATDELAYILYTSGSTGVPKGVCLSHRNALSFVTWATELLRPREPAVFSNHASFGFDLSVLDLYGAFMARGSVCLIPETIAYSAQKLVAFMVQHQISVWYSVPSVLMLMLEHGGLLQAQGAMPEALIFAGEPFPIQQLRRLRQAWPSARFFNFYGPTETNVCTSFEVETLAPDRIRPVPIGSAASGDRVWALTEAGEVAKPGQEGELWVDGPSVMLGYWGQPPQSGPYATGDRCVLGSDGNYELVGRRDHLVKVRGYRIELGEIEAVLAQHENVAEVAVFTSGEGLERRLVAALVPRTAPAPSLIALKSFAAERLPAYMLIDRVRTLDRLPRTPNGKVDRQALAIQIG